MNPFLDNGQILPIASINSVYIDEVLASDLFRPYLIMQEIDRFRDCLGISREVSNDQLLYVFNDCLSSEIVSIKEKAISIAKEFGNRLAKVIVTLKKPSSLSKENRKAWKTEHWQFWSDVKKVYLVGGLTSPILTNIFYQEIDQLLKKEKISDFTVTFIEGSSDLGTKGLTTLAKDGEYLLFDFGQTKIKRRHHILNKQEVVIDMILEPKESKYLFYKDKTDDEIKEIAIKLDKYIQDIITSTVKDVNFNGKTILISIANYVNNGMIYSARGGYGKLAYIEGNYQIHLEQALSKLIGTELCVILFHDTSAMALNFKNELSTAVLSLGTAFGVAFPE